MNNLTAGKAVDAVDTRTAVDGIPVEVEPVPRQLREQQQPSQQQEHCQQ